LILGRLRALRDRIERAERLDLVAEELDASGLLGRGRIDVDDPAAPREGARLAHLRDRLVAEIEEPRRRLLPGEPIARAKGATASRELLGRDGVLKQRAQARDDGDRSLRAREPPQREEPLVHRRARRRTHLKRHRLALREREDAFVAEPPGELRAPAARAIFARCDESDGAAAVRDQRRPRERARAGGRVRDRDALAIPEP